eukprot:863255-Amphidinium_carterae.1
MAVLTGSLTWPLSLSNAGDEGSMLGKAIGRKLDSITESVSSMPHSADLTTQRSTAGEDAPCEL